MQSGSSICPCLVTRVQSRNKSIRNVTKSKCLETILINQNSIDEEMKDQIKFGGGGGCLLPLSSKSVVFFFIDVLYGYGFLTLLLKEEYRLRCFRVWPERIF
jgi:hypothetical protein